MGFTHLCLSLYDTMQRGLAAGKKYEIAMFCCERWGVFYGKGTMPVLGQFGRSVCVCCCCVDNLNTVVLAPQFVGQCSWLYEIGCKFSF